MKKIAIDQSNYIPWKGYFDMINMVDEFVLYDDVQYTKRDWRNRNKIITPTGPRWITIPVVVKGKFFQKIKDVEVADAGWIDVHLKTLQAFYSRAPFYRQYKDYIASLYDKCRTEDHLSRINYIFLKGLCDLIGIKTKLTFSSAYELCDGKNERLLTIIRQSGSDYYLSGPAAKDYIDESMFQAQGVALEWMDYSGYPEYKQQWDSFDHGVTILDLLFNVGPDIQKYLKSFNPKPEA